MYNKTNAFVSHRLDYRLVIFVFFMVGVSRTTDGHRKLRQVRSCLVFSRVPTFLSSIFLTLCMATVLASEFSFCLTLAVSMQEVSCVVHNELKAA